MIEIIPFVMAAVGSAMLEQDPVKAVGLLAVVSSILMILRVIEKK